MMKAHITATALCTLLVALPAAAQQDQPRSTTPSRAETNPTSSPMADPHKDGGRPESHGGTVHAPQVGQGAALPADMKPTAESLARNTVTAQQYGNLASKRHTSGAVHDLGDQMVLTNSRRRSAAPSTAWRGMRTRRSSESMSRSGSCSPIRRRSATWRSSASRARSASWRTRPCQR